METVNEISYNYIVMSLLSVVITGVFISINHYTDLGVIAFVVLPFLVIALPIIAMFVYKKTNSKYAFGAYALLNLWVIIGFGIIDGLINHTSRVIGFVILQPFAEFHGGRFSPSQTPLNLLTDGTGVIVFLGSIFTAYFLYKLVRSGQDVEREL